MNKILALALGLAAPQSATADEAAQLVRLEITSRSVAYEGRSFGDRGPYEKLTAIAHMRIDPLHPENKRIVDLPLAPRDADGLVEYDIDVIILRPQDPAKARRVLLYDVVNRGIKTLALFNMSSMAEMMADPLGEGDALLMRQGFTMVWSGWQSDLAGEGMIAARFPTVSDHGQPVTGRVSTEMIFDDTTSNRITLPYPATSRDQAAARLTVQALTGSPAKTIEASSWSYADDLHVTLQRPADMDAGAIYRFEYIAKDPTVTGLGFAATRDLIAFLRHGTAAEGNPLADLDSAACERDAKGACVNPQGGVFSNAIAIGLSQSGRYLRDFLWQGFNRDLAGRRVFDGVMPIIPGGRQTFTNFRFGEPGRFSRQHEDHDVPGFTFPFTYATLTDPVTGHRDGILQSCSQTGTCPLLMHIDTSGEFWQAGASLVGTGGTARDVAFPDNVRAYMIAGGAHAPGLTLPACLYPPNPMNHAPIQRALLLAMVDWVAGRQEPPPSRWPRIDKGELVPLASLSVPKAPSLGLVWPKVLNEPIPPTGRPQWPVLVPDIDADGNDLPGIRMPQIAAPTGTYLGWNLRKPGFGEGDLCIVIGSYLPFAKDAASRDGDTRLSLAERYPAANDRAKLFGKSIDALRRERFLLDEDAVSLEKQMQ
ncbi:MAG: alpha/beta hydrolase domain-containing protein [Novosphingobium sp.]|nr:hypothetical protein [Novosphingobium sp.]